MLALILTIALGILLFCFIVFFGSILIEGILATIDHYLTLIVGLFKDDEIKVIEKVQTQNIQYTTKRSNVKVTYDKTPYVSK